MSKYKLFTTLIGQKLVRSPEGYATEDNDEYQKWLAKGNTPDPADPLPDPVPDPLEVLKKALIDKGVLAEKDVTDAAVAVKGKGKG